MWFGGGVHFTGQMLRLTVQQATSLRKFSGHNFIKQYRQISSITSQFIALLHALKDTGKSAHNLEPSRRLRAKEGQTAAAQFTWPRFTRLTWEGYLREGWESRPHSPQEEIRQRSPEKHSLSCRHTTWQYAREMQLPTQMQQAHKQVTFLTFDRMQKRA